MFHVKRYRNLLQALDLSLRLITTGCLTPMRFRRRWEGEECPKPLNSFVFGSFMPSNLGVSTSSVKVIRTYQPFKPGGHAHEAL